MQHFDGNHDFERHFWYIETDPDEFVKSLWLEGQVGRLRNSALELVEKYCTASNVYSSAPTMIVSHQFQSTNQFSPENALTILSTPLMLLVENSEYDGMFFDAVVRLYDRQGEVSYKREQRWWKYEHAAGLTHFRSRIQQIINELPTGSAFLRLYILMDSDLKEPGDFSSDAPYKREIQEIIDKCNENNIPFHILDKREIENYIPDELLAKDGALPASHRNIIEELKKLTGNQRDYYDMEKGFNSRTPQGIFSNIPKGTSAYNALKRGFHRDEYKSKQELPRLFEDSSLTSSMLERRCNPQPKELKRLYKDFRKRL